MAFTVRGALRVKEGTVQVGADVNLYRNAANVLKTDDSFTVVGSLTSGTAFVAPYGTSSPAPVTNGQIAVYHKTHVPRLVVYSGGTAYCVAFPAATHGTITVTVNSVP